MNRAARVLAVVAVLVLAGCVRVDSQTTLHSDDTFSQELVVAMTDAARSQVSAAIDMDLANVRGQIEEAAGFIALEQAYPDQVSLTDYTDGELNGFQLTISDVPLEEYSKNADDLMAALPGGAGATIEHVDDTFVVTVASGGTMDGLTNLGIEPAQLAILDASVDIGLTFTFPGLVESATAGEVQGNSVTLRITDLASEGEIVIVGSANNEFDWGPLLMWGGIALLVLLVVGGAIALVRQDVSRRRATNLPAPAAEGTSGLGTLQQPDGDAPQ